MNAELHPMGPKSAPSPRHRPMVMMVEDDPDDRRIYSTVLCYNGFDVVLAADGASALRTASEHRPDLIMLDMGLPDTNGIDLGRSLAAELAGSVPMIALSGYRELEMGGRARSAGFRHYIEKPTSPVRVLRKIEEILGRAPHSGEGPAPRLMRA